MVAASVAAGSEAGTPKVKLMPWLKGLEKPVQLTHDGTGRIFIVEQPGRVRLYRDGQLVRKPYLDLSDKVHVEYECGVLSITFHPDFARNGYLYINYTANVPDLRTVISKFRVDPKGEVVDPKTERVMMTIAQPYPNHNGGQCAFGPDGMFYIGMGDGGAFNDPLNSAQNPKSPLGKFLRIDVNERDPYGVPADNPFVNDPKWMPEIWALGMRNPWRFSFDRVTGLLYTGDVGQDKWEEVNVVTRGGNYGWRIREGSEMWRPVPAPPAFVDPILSYPHEKGSNSITGGHVYRGKQIPALYGWYVYGDYSSGRIWGLKYEGGKVVGEGVLVEPDPAAPVTPEGKRLRPTQPSAFGEDAAGELYLVDINGAIYRIEAEA
jgi:glucose/arabinose dehydrogenase